MKKTKFTFIFILILMLAFMSGNAYAYDNEITLNTDRSSNVADSDAFYSWWYAVDNSKSNQELEVEIEMYGPANIESKSGQIVFKNKVPPRKIRVYLYNVFSTWDSKSEEVTEMGYFDTDANKGINVSNGYGTLGVVSFGYHFNPGSCTGHGEQLYSYGDLTSYFKISNITSANLLSNNWQSNYAVRVTSGGNKAYEGISKVASFSNDLFSTIKATKLYPSCANYDPWYFITDKVTLVSKNALAINGYPLGRCVIKYNNPVNDIVANYQIKETGTRYETLQQAINAASAGNTILVLKDLVEEPVNVTVNKNVTIDTQGNQIWMKYVKLIVNSGCTLNLTGNGQILGDDLCDTIQNNGTLNLNGASVVVWHRGSTYGAINNTGTLNINSGWVNGPKHGIKSTAGTVNINGGQVEATGSFSDGYTYAVSSIGTNLNIKGGTIYSTNENGLGTRAIYFDGGNCVISGGKIIAEKSRSSMGLEIWDDVATSAKLEISGTTEINATSDVDSVGIRMFGSGVTINYSLVMKGGTIIAKANDHTAFTSYGIISESNSGTIQIAGGTITTDQCGIKVAAGSGKLTFGDINASLNKTTPSVTGTNSNGINAADGFNFYNGVIKGTSSTPYTGTPNKRTGNHTIEISGPTGGIYSAYLESVENYQVKETGISYMTLEEAIKGASAGNTIIVLKDVKDSSLSVVDKNLTINTNSCSLTKSVNSIVVKQGYTLNVTGPLESPGAITGGADCHTINNDGTVILENSTIRNWSDDPKNKAIYNSATAKLVVNSGEVSARMYAIENFGTAIINGGDINIVDTAVYTPDWLAGRYVYAIAQGGGSLTINGGRILTKNETSLGNTGGARALFIDGGNVTITGGQLKTIAPYTSSVGIEIKPIKATSVTINSNTSVPEILPSATAASWEGIRLAGTIEYNVNIEDVKMEGNYGIYMHDDCKATVNILGGKIRGSYQVIRKGSTGTLTIGDGTASINKTNPELISNAAYAINAPDGFNFYNGVLKGKDTTPYNCVPTLRAGNYFVNKTGPVNDLYSAFLSEADITKASAIITPTVYEYDGTAKTPSVVLNLNGTMLIRGLDYSVTYRDNVNVGTATVIITGTNSYNGTIEKTFTISKATASGTIMIVGENKPGETLTVYTEQLNINDANLKYQWYSNTTNSTTGGTIISGATSSSYEVANGMLGKYIYVVVTVDDENYTAKTFTASIAPIKLDFNVNLDETIFEYNGQEHKPGVSVQAIEN